ncbi:Nif3-like dinuclear metal center hexameric protein [Alteromonas ponticola]|uniref:Nif3-like dinuclear metal center hexameric protein n=1 Tax=Alteromonas aquimaris TaxID=2998417 RepID=A0ABT3P8W4_9ALTE|nr:Nif3-like dinuclear metal center hexameric protein [Alteromonas aquimaris]MCW8108526.1 Nif3-like dinuclear metal center hexameric protein [Alteromonas aquimaris]
MSITRQLLLQELTDLLQPDKVNDYCPNGLQIEGKPSIDSIITGVTASQALIDAAIVRKADAVLVHHGYFWRGEAPALTGIKYRRIASLIKHDINLFAYHLPIDVHPTLGNNVQLGKILEIDGLHAVPSFVPEGIVFQGHYALPKSSEEFTALISRKLNRAPVVVGDSTRRIAKVAWCTGGGQSFIEQAVQLGIDAFISGEISEQTTHIARESGIFYCAAGHHATERYGVKAVGEHLASTLKVNVEFVDIDNPA